MYQSNLESVKSAPGPPGSSTYVLLCLGLHQLADSISDKDLVREEVKKILIMDGLELVQERVPMGVLLVIFESRPDCLPQVRNF